MKPRHISPVLSNIWDKEKADVEIFFQHFYKSDTALIKEYARTTILKTEGEKMKERGELFMQGKSGKAENNPEASSVIVRMELNDAETRLESRCDKDI